MPDMFVVLTTAEGSKALVNFSASITNTVDRDHADFGLFVDGIERFRVRIESDPPGTIITPVALTHLVTALGAGPHVFEIRWRSETAVNVVSQNGATWGAGRSLTVLDLGP